MNRPIGSPSKYRRALLTLEEHELYTAASIAHRAVKQGLVESGSIDSKRLILRIRHSLVRDVNDRQFPDEGDGTLTLPGQQPSPAWLGRRWKEPLNS